MSISEMSKNRNIAFFGTESNMQSLMTSNAGSSLIYTRQVHSNNIAIYNKYNWQESIEADGIISEDKSTILLIKTADCVPVLLRHKHNLVCAALHCGWRSTKLNIIANCIKKLIELGYEAKDFDVHIGPCIRQQNYIVSKDFYNDFARQQQFFKIIDNNYFFNLSQWVRQKLKFESVGTINDCNIDTFSNNNYYSFRRNSILNLQLSDRQFSCISPCSIDSFDLLTVDLTS